MNRSRLLVLAVALTIAMSTLPFLAGGAGASSSTPGDFLVTVFIGQPVTTQGETYYKATDFNFKFSTGSVVYSGNGDGTGDTEVDDQVIIKVTHSDGTHKTFSYDYSGGCNPLGTLGPKNITNLFAVGVNVVTVTLKDICGTGEGTFGSLWITHQP